MNEPIRDAFRHSAWANQRLIEYCRSLDNEQLGYLAPGTYGSALHTLKHLCGAEAFYRFLFVGDFPDWDWGENDQLPTLDQFESWCSFLAAFWEDLLSRPIEVDSVLEHRQEDGGTRRTTTGIVLTQALHHANAHREQVSLTITALGLEPPPISGWAFGTATGRHSTIEAPA